MLLSARFAKEPKTDTYENILYTINYGEFIYGRTSWANRLKIGEQKLRTLVKLLEEDNMIKMSNRIPHRFTIYKVVNFEKYNQATNQPQYVETEGIQGNANHPSNRTPTNCQPTANRTPTTKEDSKTGKKEKQIKDIYLDLVLLTKDEHKNLVDKLGQKHTEEMIDRLNSYGHQKTKRFKEYTSHYHVILDWVRRDNEKPKVTVSRAAASILEYMEDKDDD